MSQHSELTYKQLGTTNLTVSSLAFGGASLGSRVGGKASSAAVVAAYDQGINFFDTAPFYGQGESEKIIGRELKAHRSNVVISTKIGLYPSPALRVAAKFKPMVRAALQVFPKLGQRVVQKSVQGFMQSSKAVQFDPETIETSINSSLKRLQTDFIDLLLLHVTPDASVIEDVIDKLKAVQQQGKIRYFGASSSGVEETLMWLGLEKSGICTLQTRLNMFEIPVIEECLPNAIRNNVAIVAREPFARGRLLPAVGVEGGKLDFVGKGYDSRFSFLGIENKRTVPQAAIKFLLQTTGVSSILAGMTTLKHLEQNLNAFSAPDLTDDELRKVYELHSETRS